MGLVRGNNEDSVYAGPRLLAIADGMGGHAAGEVASKIVISALEQLDEDRPLGDLLAALRSAVEEANRGIADSVADNRDLEGMGTTLTALRFVGSHVGLVHVGDSRAYLLRGDHLSQITHDDTYVQSLVDSGRITAEEASHHPRKSVILRALTGAEVDPDVSIREARVGDRYLLCSDGLSDVVTTATLFETLGAGGPQECADRLVDLALRGGGPDNITCIVADVIDTGNGSEGDEVPVIAGAIVDPHGTQPLRLRADSSPAERAARIAAPAPEPATASTPQHAGRRRWLSAPVLVLLSLVIVAGGLYAAYAYTQRQYFVGQDGQEVAVFRGVDAEFGPLKFYKVATNTSLKLSDLRPAARSQVENGITAASQSDAQKVVDNLRGELLPSCASLTSPSPSPSPSATPGAEPTPTPGSTPASSPVAAASPTPGPSDASGSDSSATEPAPPPRSPQVGVDCK
jgi:protein phosphatase